MGKSYQRKFANKEKVIDQFLNKFPYEMEVSSIIILLKVIMRCKDRNIQI